MFISEDMTEWSASQGDWLMNDSQDEAIVVEGRWAEQQGVICCFGQLGVRGDGMVVQRMLNDSR